jgi:ABC-type Fe3+/spermidine/putrescine transport system ATPase subunit
MYARLGFSVAAHVDPEVLIVDEVLSVGDYDFQKRCMDRMRTVLNAGTTVLLVSHNLKAVTELCQRTMLLDRGKMVTIGATDSVVQRYLSDARNSTHENESGVYISEVKIRGEAGEQLKFESGETAWVDVEVTARRDAEKLAVAIWLTDESQRIIFETCSKRLGHCLFALQTGQTYRGTFELSLNMAYGAFGVCVGVHRYDIQHPYDKRAPATLVFIGSTKAVRGTVNCFPRWVEVETVATDGLPQKTNQVDT